MKHKLLTLSALVLGTMAAQAAMAQSSPTSQLPPTRTEVHEDAVRDKNVSNRNKVHPEVERNARMDAQKPTPSGTNQPASRSDVKAEAKRARDAGEIPTGDTSGTTPALEKKKAAGQLPNTREDVKAEIPAARTRGEIQDQKHPKPSSEAPR